MLSLDIKDVREESKRLREELPAEVLREVADYESQSGIEILIISRFRYGFSSPGYVYIKSENAMLMFINNPFELIDGYRDCIVINLLTQIRYQTKEEVYKTGWQINPIGPSIERTCVELLIQVFGIEDPFESSAASYRLMLEAHIVHLIMRLCRVFQLICQVYRTYEKYPQYLYFQKGLFLLELQQFMIDPNIRDLKNMGLFELYERSYSMYYAYYHLVKKILVEDDKEIDRLIRLNFEDKDVKGEEMAEVYNIVILNSVSDDMNFLHVWADILNMPWFKLGISEQEL